MFVSNSVLLILDNTVILSMLFSDIELIGAGAWCFLWLEDKALHPRTKDGLLL